MKLMLSSSTSLTFKRIITDDSPEVTPNDYFFFSFIKKGKKKSLSLCFINFEVFVEGYQWHVPELPLSEWHK